MEFSADIFGTWKEAKLVSSRREDTSEVSNEGMEESDVSAMDECAMGRPAKYDLAKDGWVLDDSAKDGWVLGVSAKGPVMSTSMSELSSLYSTISAKGLSFAGSIGSMECRKAAWVQG